MFVFYVAAAAEMKGLYFTCQTDLHGGNRLYTIFQRNVIRSKQKMLIYISFLFSGSVGNKLTISNLSSCNFDSLQNNMKTAFLKALKTPAGGNSH